MPQARMSHGSFDGGRPIAFSSPWTGNGVCASNFL